MSHTERIKRRRRPTDLDADEAVSILFSIEIVEPLARYTTVAPEAICGQVASFLTALVSPASPFESQVLNQFISLNSHPLAVWCVMRNSSSMDAKCDDVSTWRLYDAELARLATQRAALLLRIIMVDTKPLEDVIQSNLKAGATPALQ
jgi:hypothetical protein